MANISVYSLHTLGDREGLKLRTVAYGEQGTAHRTLQAMYVHAYYFTNCG